jgi:hypothetical protein
VVENTHIDYDFCIVSRGDMRVDIDDVSKIFDKEYFIIPTTKENFEVEKTLKRVTDVFSVAPISLMRRAWDYRNLEILNQFYESSFGNEDMFKNMLFSF